MRYTYSADVKLYEVPNRNWNKYTQKETLQYAVGALLYMPATKVEIADKIINKKYEALKSLVLDLEDSIGDSMVEEAEKSIEKILSKLHFAISNKTISINELPLVFIRVREIGQMTRLLKRCGNTMQVITGFVLPKFDKSNATKYIEEFKNIMAEIKVNIYMMPIIESKEVMFKQSRMEQLLYINDVLKPIAKNVLGISVGARDFCNVFGIRRDINTSIWDIRVVADCLSDIVNVFGKNYVVTGPVCEYFGENPNEKWAESLKKELKHDYVNGTIGKIAIHPSQLSIIQESLIVPYYDYEDAKNILAMSSDLIGVQKSFNQNKMNEVKTHTNWAKRIIGLANIYGVKMEDE